MNNKDKFGEVFTPISLVQNIFNDVCCLFGNDFFKKIKYILEPGSGLGVFFDFFVNKNNVFHKDFIYTMNEINNKYEKHLKQLSKYWEKHIKVNIGNILDLYLEQKQDLIIGNLPFNSNSKKFVPGLAKNNKYDNSIKSITIWNIITKHCFQHLLGDDGYFLCIIPCIWLKPDKSGIYELFTQIYTLKMLKIYNCKEANTIFSYNCQTPICYVLVQKKLKIDKHLSLSFNLYNKQSQSYQSFSILKQNLCIPTDLSHMLYKSYLYIIKYNIKSSSCLLKKISYINTKLFENAIFYNKGGLEMHQPSSSDISDTSYKIITGSLYNKKTNILTLNGFVSHKQALYGEKCKLILPHKRLARFIKDYTGEYSCYGRDFYVFLCNSNEDVDKLYDFFNIDIIRNIIENGFTVRMNFIEKYIFDYLPNILEDNINIQHYLDFITE
jgi:hypothetical protein